MSDNMDKYIYYTINPREQLFKQTAGFIFFLHKANVSKKTLVLPRFELKNKFYDYSELFDFNSINDNFNVIPYNKYVYLSASNQSIGENSVAYIGGFWQFPLITSKKVALDEYMRYRKHISFNKRYHDLIPIKKERYLAIHWRQDDFLTIRPQVVLSKEALVDYVESKLKELNINSVYLSTDSKNLNDIEYIKERLPVFSHKETLFSKKVTDFPKTAYKNGYPIATKVEPRNINNIDYSILESIICAQSDYFIGTSTSLYSTHIIGERIKMGYKKDEQEIKIIK